MNFAEAMKLRGTFVKAGSGDDDCRQVKHELAICITFHYVDERLKYLEMVLASLGEFKVYRPSVVIITNDIDAVQEDEIKRRLENCNFDCGIIKCRDLAHPYMLTWAHKRFLQEFADNDLVFRYFIYLEDDIVLREENVIYFDRYKAALADYGLLPSFIRFERYQGVAYSVDFKRPALVRRRDFIDIAAMKFTNNYPPYAAMYIMDRDLAREHVNSDAFDEFSSRALVSWDVRERAASGNCFVNVPPGRMHRYAVPIDDKLNVHPMALVWHCADNYSTKPSTKLGKLRLDRAITKSWLEHKLLRRSVKRRAKAMSAPKAAARRREPGE